MDKTQTGVVENNQPWWDSIFPITFWVGNVLVGIFNYSVGFSKRDITTYKVLDCGYIKFMQPQSKRKNDQ